MNIDWQKENNAPDPGTQICVLDDLKSGSISGFEFGNSDPFRMIIYRNEDEVHGYMNLCPHHWIAMNRQDGEFKMWDSDRHQIMCVHHTAVFELVDRGQCIGGPCKGSSLIRVPLEISGRKVRIAKD